MNLLNEACVDLGILEGAIDKVKLVRELVEEFLVDPSSAKCSQRLA